MKHTIELPVQFRDFDVLGHVNSTMYLQYMESARVDLIRKLVSPEPWYRPPLIVVALRCEYQRPITSADVVRVRVWVSRIGGRSWDFDYEVLNASGEVSAVGRTTQVAYDYERGETTPIPDALREGLEAHAEAPLAFHEAK